MIVIIDDSPTALVVLKNFAGGRGLREVQTFTDPMKGLEFLLQTPVDAVVLDCSMPGLDGLQLTQRCCAKATSTATHRSFSSREQRTQKRARGPTSPAPRLSLASPFECWNSRLHSRASSKTAAGPTSIVARKAPALPTASSAV